MRWRFPLICLGVLVLSARIAPAQVDASGWAQVPAILARIIPPTFPTNDFPITDYGAVGDGVTLNSAAFSNAIAACTSAGGGRVVVPPGVFLTGAIQLRNNVNLFLAPGTVIWFSTNPADFLPVVYTRFEGKELMNYSPFIYSFEQENIAITGSGVINGQGGSGPWWGWKFSQGGDVNLLYAMAATNAPISNRVFGAGHVMRPTFVQPFRCRNVLIEGVTILNSPFWVINPVYCTNVTVRGVTVNSGGPNSDGCDPDSSEDVLIRDCSFSEGDDCLSVKAGQDVDGLRVNIPARNIVIQNCKFQDGHGGVTLGSDSSGGIANVFAENCAFNSPSLNMALRFKTNPARGGYITNIFIRNCVIKTAGAGIHMTMAYTSSSGGNTGTNYPIVRNIDIRDCAFGSTGTAVSLQGWDAAHPISDVNIVNCRFGSGGSGFSSTTNINLINNRGGGL